MTSQQEIPISKFRPSPWNFNKMDEETFKELMEDIEKHGIQEKIIVRKMEDGTLRIIGGHWRIEALMKLGWRTVPREWVDIREMTDEEERKYIRSSNIRGKKIDLLKEAEHYKAELEERGLTLTQLAEELGMDKSKLSRILARLNFPGPAKVILMNAENLTAGVVNEIARIKDPWVLIKYLKRAEAENWSVREARAKIKEGVTLDGEAPKLSRERTKKYSIKEIDKLEMEERGALSSLLSKTSSILSKASAYLKEKKAPELAKRISYLSRTCQTIKREVEGSVYKYNREKKKSEEVYNKYRVWLSLGSKEDRMEKKKAVAEKLREILS